MTKTLETKTKAYDLWGLLGKKYDSKCCSGKKAEVIMYDHTGAVSVKCECGKKYWDDKGAYRV
jgi:hypothetical protein